MQIRNLLMITGVGVLTGTLSFPVAADAATPSPNFVFILVDDMGWTGTSLDVDNRRNDSKSDYYRTPNIESLAKEGLCFSNAYAPAPMCSPSRASFLTGKSPAQLHLTTPGRYKAPSAWHKISQPEHIHELPGNEITIAEVLKSNNYMTAHYGKWHLGNGGPEAHGFDESDGETGNGGPGNYEDPNPKDIYGITERAQKFMAKQTKAGKPFYLQLSHYAVHAPTQAMKSSESQFESLKEGRNHSDSSYAAMTYDFDQSVGMVLDTIDELGIKNNTYVIFMSDNGAGSKRGSKENAPLAGGKGSLWEGGVRVPLIIRGPEIKAGSYNYENVIGYDLFPTIFELVTIVESQPKSVEGTSVVLLLLGAKEIKRKYEELIFHYPHYGKGPKQKPQSAIIDGNYKLVLSYETNEKALYDLTKDIGEENDLSKKNPEKADQMYKKMMAYLKRVDAQLPTENKNYDSNATNSSKGKSGSNGFVSRFDKDSNGKISKSEFTGPERRFSKLDSNGDGFIDSTEAPTGPPTKKRK